MMERVDFQLHLKPPHPVSAYMLVMGGWHPLLFASSYVVLLDRSVLRLLSSVSGTSKRQDSKRNKWWLSSLNNSSCTLNPVLCAMEGSEQTPPTYMEFRSSFDQACTYIKTHLPQAKLVRFSEQCYEAVYQTMKDMHVTYLRECDFLIEVSPLLVNRSSALEARKIERQILDLRDKFHLQTFSLSVVAALSCLYESQTGGEPSIGRRILKPSQNYRSRQAHNALSDLRALGLLAAGNGLGLGDLAYCTGDKALVAFWCALKVQRGEWGDNNATINVELGAQLFPRLSDPEINELYGRLTESKIKGHASL